MRAPALLLPLAALALLPGCKDVGTPGAAATASRDPVAANAAAIKDPRRVLPLEGGVNFRDLGGYMTADGRVTKWDVLYRAGNPAGLTAKDQAELARRGIRTVCDLRASEERKAEPNPYVAANADVTYWTRDYAADAGDLMKVLGGPDASAQKSRAAMTGFYRALPEQHAPAFRQMFAFLAEGKVPLAFNCSAGKDRTGTAAALVLTLLGVPRETVVADYALSDDLVDYMGKLSQGPKDGPYAALARLPREVVAPLLASDPAYIEAALGAIEAKHGSVDAFIEKELGVTPAMKQAIIANLTDPA
ncbi:tyrosine-protein phosphatase [Porphyrobacter sp. AAP82]|uniref:tyrosine-protein phosphatase n=1 Tax=Porphyrobacter sp. AAP82 TaxID=1248917 RepID=UPI0002FF0142|nr:tyrosine-protein phosphatase [Porphyrobacter sp. AAP82]